MKNQFSRRELLQGFALAYLGAATPVAFASNEFQETNALIKAIKSDPALEKLGKMFLKQNPEFNDIYKLEKALNTHLQSSIQGGAELSRGILKSRIEKDFKEDKIISVEGWQFSRTETYIAAISVLS